MNMVKRGKQKNSLKRKSLINKKRIDFPDSISGIYKQCWNYIKESRKFIFIMIYVFFAFALIGYFIPAPPEVQEAVLKIFKELKEKTEGMNQLELTLFIFLNNLQSSFLGVIFGVVLGIFPFISSMANGYILGFVSLLAVNQEGISILFTLLPHGIFELPAVFISLGMGLRLGSFIFQKMGKKIESLKYYLFNSLLVFIFVIIPLLVIAAIIEAGFIVLFG